MHHDTRFWYSRRPKCCAALFIFLKSQIVTFFWTSIWLDCEQIVIIFLKSQLWILDFNSRLDLNRFATSIDLRIFERDFQEGVLHWFFELPESGLNWIHQELRIWEQSRSSAAASVVIWVVCFLRLPQWIIIEVASQFCL